MSSAPQVSRADAPSVAWLDKPWVPPALVCGLVFMVYAGAIGFGFVYDDMGQIVRNPWLTSFSYVPRFFTSHVWAFANVTGAYWRPLFLIWCLVHRMLFGTQPAMWHLDSILLHVAATALLYMLVRRLTRDRFAGVIAALIFGLHPALIESVAWVSGVTDPLLAVCLIPAFLAFLNWRERHSAGWLGASLLLYALALMSKEPAVILPALVFAYAWIYGEETPARRLRTAVMAVAPYVPVTFVYAVIHLVVLQRVDYSHNLTTPLRTVMTAPALLLFYLRTLVFPAVISPHYNLKLVMAYSFTRVVAPALVLLAVVGLLYAWARRERDLARLTAFAGAWMLLPILPALYLAPQGAHDFAHARYLYLPCIGLGMIIAAAIRRLPVTAAQMAAAGALAILLALGTTTQQRYWASDMLLFSRGVEVAPDNPTALTGLGVELGKRERYPEAIRLFQHALAIDPNDWHPNFSLGYTYFILGRYSEAEPLIARAVEINPWGADPDQYAYLGLVEMKLGNLTKAEWAVRQALQRQPASRFHYALALILEQQGRLHDAAKEFQAELQLNPGNIDAQARLARAQAAGQ